MALGFGGSLLLGLCAAVFIYFRLIRYERVAARHVPPDSSLVLRVDVEHAIVYEPFRKHLLPLVNQGRSGRAPSATLPPRLARIQAATGVELAVDIRELVLALGASSQDWLLVLGGKFPKSGVVSGLSRMLTEEGVPNELVGDGQTSVLATGQAFGQAKDGALLFASSRSRLEAALPVRAAPTLQPSAEGAVALVASGVWDTERWPATRMPASLRSNISQVTGIMKLSADPSLQMDVRLRRGPASALASDLGLAVQRLIGADKGGQNLNVASENPLDVRVIGPEALRVVTPFSRDDLDRAAENLATWLRNVVFSPVPAPIGSGAPSQPAPGDTSFR